MRILRPCLRNSPVRMSAAKFPKRAVLAGMPDSFMGGEPGRSLSRGMLQSKARSDDETKLNPVESGAHLVISSVSTSYCPCIDANSVWVHHPRHEDFES